MHCVEFVKWHVIPKIKIKKIINGKEQNLSIKRDFSTLEDINEKLEDIVELIDVEKDYISKLITDIIFNIREHAEPPYGRLREIASDNALEVAERIENNITPKQGVKDKKRKVYIHSVDTDAPSFEADTAGGDRKLSILNLYDNMLKEYGDKKKPAFLIGGYNLSSRPGDESFTGDDFSSTQNANLIDRIIRKGIYQSSNTLVYPTEPNFLIKASTYEKLKHKGHPWGEAESEGYSLLTNYLEYRTGKSKGGFSYTKYK